MFTTPGRYGTVRGAPGAHLEGPCAGRGLAGGSALRPREGWRGPGSDTRENSRGRGCVGAPLPAEEEEGAATTCEMEPELELRGKEGAVQGGAAPPAFPPPLGSSCGRSPGHGGPRLLKTLPRKGRDRWGGLGDPWS